ncbi:hypothetical protein Pmani_013436 [Petrolisthes manimaculis]|uniref:Uncharacterized protein n=1 Tax=Petrolisthes manimaculis TaxID=1843537 RepID=A0AAE1PUY9_9EUCA|nr:hypothetical protein Pmani_013436 [Petrolisthes manimaculis]
MLVIVASSILYSELATIGFVNITLTLMGFIVNIVALFLLYQDRVNNMTTEIIDSTEHILNKTPILQAKINLYQAQQFTPCNSYQHHNDEGMGSTLINIPDENYK